MAQILCPMIDGSKYQSVMNKDGLSVETAATSCEVTYSPHGFWTLHDGSPKKESKSANTKIMEWCVDHQPFMESFQQVTARYCGDDAQFVFNIVNISDVETGRDTFPVLVPKQPVHYADFGKSIVVDDIH